MTINSRLIQMNEDGTWKFTTRIMTNETPNEWKEIFRLSDHTIPSNEYHAWVMMWRAIYKQITEDVQDCKKLRKMNNENYAKHGLILSKCQSAFRAEDTITYRAQEQRTRLRGIARAMMAIRMTMKENRKAWRATRVAA